MTINSLNAINYFIKKNIIISLVTLLTLCLVALNVIYFNNLKAINQKNIYQISSNIDLLKSHLSEKIAIIASSNVFIDYLRSGEITRKALKTDFTYDINSLNLKEVSGMQIHSENNEKIFSDGSASPYFVDLPLCYFDRELNSMLGSCAHHLILYLKFDEVVKSLKKINDNIVPCKSCEPINFLSNKFGSFNIANLSNMPLSISIKTAQNLNIYTINFIVIIVMFFLAIWNWSRTNFILEKYLTHPIKKITNKLKMGDELLKNNEIDELSYLIDEIRDREIKLSHAKENEHLTKIGQVASQVAHDIKSPLAVINNIINRPNILPEDQRSIISNANQELHEIADNLLSQYRASSLAIPEEVVNQEHGPYNILGLLNSLVLGKKAEYANSSIEINFDHDNYAAGAVINISSVDFKRVISNIINNAVDAIARVGKIEITLKCIDGIAYILIKDNGVGMGDDLIHKLLSGQSISCKANGSGIGLSSSCKFIKIWKGEMDITSQPNKGTTVTVKLPITFENKLTTNQQRQQPDLILIDDNKTVSDAWKLSALLKNKTIIIFNNICDVRDNIKNYDTNTPIYIDSDLGESVRGEQFAKWLFELGYMTIYLTTGYNKASFGAMYWVKAVIGKDPVF